MHYLGFVFVKEPTREAVEKALADWKGDEWDWYRCGGRWDGYLLGAEEMKRRETDKGFNFADENDDPARNSCRVADLPADVKVPYFFVSGWEFVPKEYYDRHAKSKHGEGYGAIVQNAYYEARYAKALVDHAGDWVVVVDIHN